MGGSAVELFLPSPTSAPLVSAGSRLVAMRLAVRGGRGKKGAGPTTPRQVRPAEAAKRGDRFRVIVATAKSPSDFYVQRVSPGEGGRGYSEGAWQVTEQ